MRTRTKVLAVFGATIAAAGGYAFTYTGTYGEVCERLGGKWASADGRCVTRSCYKNRACGYWANPGHRCDRLKVGNPIAEVYFQLGEPDQIDGTRYIWRERKGGAVSAEIEREKLKSIACAT